MHILVVDDDMLARMTAAQCVKQQGHTAGMADGGARAIEMLQSDEFNLILLDLMMPDMDGFEVLAKIMEDPRLRQIPIIMVSGAEDAESIDRCLEMGAVGHLAKPLDSASLAAQISDFKDRQLLV
jgi:CheY-like chemotaxis protein